MGKKYRRYKNAIEKYLASEKGRRFFHIAYSLGAAIVIIGTLFKLNHYPYSAEIMLVGLATEAALFALSAFDRPMKDYKWEEVYPALGGDGGDKDNEDGTVAGKESVGGAGTVIIGRSLVVPPGGSNTGGGTVVEGSIIAGSSGTPIVSDTADMTGASEKYTVQLTKLSESMEKFAEITSSLTQVSDILLDSFKSITDNSEGIGNNTRGYITQMETLNRNIAGLNTIYEIQLKGVSGQINTIEQVNAGLDRIKNLYEGSLSDSSIFKTETEKMAQQLAELNRVYARMLQAMTVNMNIGGFGGTLGTQSNEIK